MKRSTLQLLLHLFVFNTIAQSPFYTTIGGPLSEFSLYSTVTQDGGYAVVGWTTSFGAGGWDLYLVKTSAAGELEWTRTYGGQGDEVDCAVEQTADGGFLIAARTNSFGAGEADVYVVKTDAKGQPEWTKTYGGPGWDEGHSLLPTTEGGFIIAGYTGSFGAGQQDVYVIKCNATGGVEWSRTYGGAGSERGHKIRELADGSYLIAGETTSPTTDYWNMFLMRIGSSGEPMWVKVYNGNGVEFGWDVAPTNDGGYALAGFTNCHGAGANDACLLKLDNVGEVQWAKTYGGPERDIAISVRETNDGGLFVCGETASFGHGWDDAYVLRTTSVGELIWSKTYGGAGDDGARYGAQLADGGYYIAGFAQMQEAENWDFLLMRTDEMGSTQGCNESPAATIVQGHTVVASDFTFSIGTGAVVADVPANAGYGGAAKACSASSIAEEGSGYVPLEIYPNPTFGPVIVTSTDASVNATLITIDVLGDQVIPPCALQGGFASLDLSGVAPGAYLITAERNGRRMESRYLIKQ